MSATTTTTTTATTTSDGVALGLQNKRIEIATFVVPNMVFDVAAAAATAAVVD